MTPAPGDQLYVLAGMASARARTFLMEALNCRISSSLTSRVVWAGAAPVPTERVRKSAEAHGRVTR